MTGRKKQTRLVFREETDLDAVKRIAKILLRSPIRACPEMPLLVNHPFFLSAMQPISNDEAGQYDLINILDNPEGRSTIIRQIEQQIDEKESVTQIGFILIDKKYRLLFLSMAAPFCSRKDIGLYLNTLWVTVEFISQDPNVSNQDIVRLFRQSDPSTLMSEKERDFLDCLPNEITIYRGVCLTGKSRHKLSPYGFSWSLDKQVANWYCTRFGCAHNDNAVLYEARIQKKDILAYFGDRADEQEVVVNPKKVYGITTHMPEYGDSTYI